MSSLSDFLDVLTAGRRVRISVADLSGILNHASLKLPYRYKFHASAFCDTAKSTKRGYALCVGCKNLCNAKAMRERAPFSGLCPYGLFEAVYPVILHGEIVCAVYAGGGVLSVERSLQKCRAACEFSDVPCESLSPLLSSPPPSGNLTKRFTKRPRRRSENISRHFAVQRDSESRARRETAIGW